MLGPRREKLRGWRRLRFGGEEVEEVLADEFSSLPMGGELKQRFAEIGV
jgi:hypothetical protein